MSETQSAKSETSKSEASKSETSSAEQQPDKPKPTPAAPHEGEFPPNPFDFSAMTGLLNVSQLLSCLRYI